MTPAWLQLNTIQSILLIKKSLVNAYLVVNNLTLSYSSRIQIEDTDICENVQKGMRSRSFTHGRYAPLIEHAVHDFHLRLVKDFEFAYQH